MTMNEVTRKLLSSSITLILLILSGIVNTSEIAHAQLTNHENGTGTDSSTLKIEARSEDNSLIDLSPRVKPENETSVYRSIIESRSNIKNAKSSVHDSYLNALEYSHSSNNPREGIIHIDVKSKPSSVVRRTHDSPVYRPHDDYGPPKGPVTSYGIPSTPIESEKTPRIIYGAPDSVIPAASPVESFQSTPSNSYSLPSQQISGFNNPSGYSGGNKYGVPPQINYGIPSATYGAPSATYGPAPLPPKIYGPPHNNYLPVKQLQQAYGPPQGSGFALPQLPSLPSIDFSFPFSLKLNAYTIAKIILKLIIFKMIVKFIAILCLLLFIPKLEMKKEENDDGEGENDEGRKLITHHFTTEQLNNLTSVVLESIEKYQNANGVEFNDEKKCTSVGCRVTRLLQSGETWKDYLKLFYNYVHEENDVVPSTDKESPTKIT